MRIVQITAKNYRTLEDVTIGFNSNYCSLSGHNNAGKSSVIRIINIFLNENSRFPWARDSYSISYAEDRTKWAKDGEIINIGCKILLESGGDGGLISYIERQTKRTFGSVDILIEINTEMDQHEERKTTISVNGSALSRPEDIDIIRKIRSLNTIIVHNSTRSDDEVFVSSGKSAFLYDLSLNGQDQKKVAEAEARLQKSLKKAAKAQTGELNEMLGRLRGRINVELTSDLISNRRIPLGVNLTDRNVEIPLGDWGSGTQNKTKVLMSLLQANRLRTDAPTDEKVSPIVVIEEPESFLHPSAQAEFGHVLQTLAEEFGIQVIVATHSPFMLNQVSPESNILLQRKISRGKEMKSEVTDTSGSDWMVPFAEHLGIIPPEFSSWRTMLTSSGSRIVLVEGEIDKEYIEFIRAKYPDKFSLPADVEIISYGGKDALKNTTILKFLVAKVEKFFITFDLDALSEVKDGLVRIGLEEGKNYIPVGINKAGKQAIEGLLPDRVTSAVYGRETDLVMALTAQSSKDRNSAKSILKQRLLDEFKNNGDYTDAELKMLFSLGKAIAKTFL